MFFYNGKTLGLCRSALKLFYSKIGKQLRSMFNYNIFKNEEGYFIFHKKDGMTPH